jgi:4-alpha-glucanotransferase
MSSESRSGQKKSPFPPAGRKAGVGMHFSSLAGPHGIGDIGDSAQAFVDALASMKIGVWQFLPTGPTAYGDSPYQPLSTFAGNEMLIGLEPLIRQGLLTSAEAHLLTGSPSGWVDYGKLIPAKYALLNQAASRFISTAPARLKSDFDDFLQLNDSNWLADYAVYRVLKTLHRERPWQEWDRSFVQRDAGTMQKVLETHRTAIENIKIVQFFFDRQWRALKHYANGQRVQLFGDLDYFSADGQLWGNPLYDWKFHSANGYRWWIKRIQHAVARSDLVRIDHFRGFESFWSVCYGAETAREGEWLRGPGDDLFDSLRASLGGLPIVAEDLGVITPEVDALRHRHGIAGMKVLQFEVADPHFKLGDIGKNCVCYTGTHDNDTTLGWFNGGVGDTRSEQDIAEIRKNALEVTGGAPDTIHLDMIRLAFNSQARIAIAPMQDFLGLGSEARMNVPGTTLNNWRWRLAEEQMSQSFLESTANLVEETLRV